jgi:hypothetical protein
MWRCRREGRKTFLKIANEIGNILKSDMEANGGAAGRPPGCGANRRAVEGDRQAFEAAPGSADAEQGQLVQEGMNGCDGSRLEYGAEKSARAGKIPFPDRVAGMALEGRMEYAHYFGAFFEPAPDLHAGGVMLGETHPHGAQSA